MAIEGREQRGKEIAALSNQIKRMDDYSYQVQSQSGNGDYAVLNTETGWVCSCPDHLYRGVKCKHIYAVEFSSQLRKEAEARRIEPLTQVSECIFCGSTNIVKDGVRKNKFGDIQKFNCKGCGRYFTFNLGFDTIKPDVHLVRLAKLYGTDPFTLCRQVSEQTGLPVHVVDTVFWRASEQGRLRF